MALHTPYLAGWAWAEITPDIPCRMGGYAARSAPARATHDPLYAYALALGNPAQPLVVIICDLVGVDGALVSEVRQRVAQQVPGAITWLGATHTHSGPDVARSLSFAREQPDPALSARVISGACDAALQAIAAMSVRVTTGLTALTRIRCGPSSRAITRVRASSAPFEAQ